MEPDREIEAMATIARAFSAFGDNEEEVLKRIVHGWWRDMGVQLAGMLLCLGHRPLAT